MKVKCKHCKFAKHDPYYNKFGYYHKNAWGSYCSRNGSSYDKFIFNEFNGQYVKDKEKTTRDSNKNGNCEHYQKKWYLFWVK